MSWVKGYFRNAIKKTFQALPSFQVGVRDRGFREEAPNRVAFTMFGEERNSFRMEGWRFQDRELQEAWEKIQDSRRNRTMATRPYSPSASLEVQLFYFEREEIED